MLSKFPALALALVLPLTGCSLQEATDKLDSYSKMSTKDLAVQLVTDGSEVSHKAKQIAWCQAKVINDSGVPQAVVDALIKQDGRTVVERARSLKRPGLAKKLKACYNKYA